MATFGFRHAPVVPSAGQGGGRPQAAPPPPPPQQQPPAGPLAAAYAAAAAASDEGAEVPRPVPIGLLSIVDVLATIDAWAE